MHTEKAKENERSAARAERKPRAGGAYAESRLVIRDERTASAQTPASPESSAPDRWVKDYEAEHYKLEKRGRKAVIIAHPVPFESVNPNVAHVDWCAFTLTPSQNRGQFWVMSELRRLFGIDCFLPRKTGLFGYVASAIIEEAGLMAWGGENQRGSVYVSLNAQGCSRITDWKVFQDWLGEHNAKITRVDLAHDDFTGETINIDTAQQWWNEGGFNNGGRQPHAQPYGDWWGLAKGRSVYIGERANGKLLRVYEKGKQLGDKESPWVRVELELHNKCRVIPLDSLTRPGAYLAGAYPALHFLSAEQLKIRTLRKAVKIAYARSVEVARTQFGKLIGLMLKISGGDYVAVVDALKRDGLPGRLDPYSYYIRTAPDLPEWLDTGGPGHALVPV